jgi:hypothetical protein
VYTYLHKKWEKPYFGKNFYSNATFKSIMIEDLKLPAMGWRYWDTANSSGTWGNFGYQSSSPYSDERSWVFYFWSYYIIYQINSYPYAYGWPIRCFKN